MVRRGEGGDRQPNCKESWRKYAKITAKRAPGIALGTQKGSPLRPGGACGVTLGTPGTSLGTQGITFEPQGVPKLRSDTILELWGQILGGTMLEQFLE